MLVNHDYPCTLFRLNGRRVFVVDKARKDRARLTDAKHKRFKQLRPVIERYADVFRNADFIIRNRSPRFMRPRPLIYPPWNPLRERRRANGSVSPPSPSTGERFIRPGRWSWSWPSFPIERILPSSCSMVVATREALLDQWAFEYPRVKKRGGQVFLGSELALISRLDLLICMDSANMHFASLVGTRVFSVWGATHPYAGFYGYHQDPEDCIQLDLPCRPCSVFGQKPCLRKDWACMRQLNPDLIINKVLTSLNEMVSDEGGH